MTEGRGQMGSYTGFFVHVTSLGGIPKLDLESRWALWVRGLMFLVAAEGKIHEGATHGIRSDGRCQVPGVRCQIGRETGYRKRGTGQGDCRLRIVDCR